MSIGDSSTSTTAALNDPAEAAGPARAVAITTTAALEALWPEWERLWSLASHATPFQSPCWLVPWWRHVAPGELAAVAVREAATGELVGIAPLYVWPDPASGLRLLFPVGIGTTDDLDWLAKPGWDERVVSAVMQHLVARAARWDVLEIPQLRRDAALLRAVAPAGWRQEIIAGEPNPALRWDGAQPAGAPIPRRMASNIRTCRARAARAGRVEYELADAKTLPAFLDALIRLHAQRWSARGLPGVLGDSSIIEWHREAASLLQAAGLLRLHGLRFNGELIAVLYCLMDAPQGQQRRSYYYIGGFDPQFGWLSPGTLLVAQAIDQAVAEGATAFDFLRGAEHYKYRWGAFDQPMYRLQLRKANAKGG